MYSIVLFCALVLLGFLLTLAIRQLSLRLHIIDEPNVRSSHKLPTPRGGGLAIIIASYIAMFVIYELSELSQPTLITVLGATLLVSVIGFLDDIYSLSAGVRLCVHFIAALWALFWLQGLPPISILSYSISLTYILGVLLGAVYLVWMLNLFNFMDGIDGIASIQVISVCTGVLLISKISGVDPLLNVALEPILYIIIATTLGFMLLNFPKAKIFMGDAGSGFLGLILAILCLAMTWDNAQWFWCWMILMGVFIVDTSFTLVRRFMRNESVTQAHRSHAYQHAAQKYKSHVVVTLAVGGINMFFLCPIAYLVYSGALANVVGLLIAYVPLLVAAKIFDAGAPARAQ